MGTLMLTTDKINEMWELAGEDAIVFDSQFLGKHLAIFEDRLKGQHKPLLVGLRFSQPKLEFKQGGAADISATYKVGISVRAHEQGN